MNKYTTVSFPKPLIEAINKLVKELGYWPSTTAFAQEALVEKLLAERVHRPDKGVYEIDAKE